jgi:hypothetical protein
MDEDCTIGSEGFSLQGQGFEKKVFLDFCVAGEGGGTENKTF